MVIRDITWAQSVAGEFLSKRCCETKCLLPHLVVMFRRMRAAGFLPLVERLGLYAFSFGIQAHRRGGTHLCTLTLLRWEGGSSENWSKSSSSSTCTAFWTVF